MHQRGNNMYKTWAQMNNTPEQVGSVPIKPKSTLTVALKDLNHLKFALKSYRVVVVKVEADWCEPCKAMAPSYEKLAQKTQASGKFIYFTDDVDQETSVHAAAVEAVPTFFVYTDGDITPKKKFTGDFAQLEELINRILFRFEQDVQNTETLQTQANSSINVTPPNSEYSSGPRAPSAAITPGRHQP